MKFKSLIQLLDYFKDEQTSLEYYEKIRWKGNPKCPYCNTYNPYKIKKGYKCSNSECYKRFTVKIGTVFQNSKIPFRTWFVAIYLVSTHKKGISSVQLATNAGFTQKTAWFALHRIREMMRSKDIQIFDDQDDENYQEAVEADEVFIGGRETGKHHDKKRSKEDPCLKNNGEIYEPKKVVIGAIQRNGNVILKHIESANTENISSFIKKHIPSGYKLYTDEYKGYLKIGAKYDHETINHSLKIYVNGDVHTNTIENFWSVLKRCLYGTYHQVSSKHMPRYLDECSIRFNTREYSPNERFDAILGQNKTVLSYKTLIAA
jgi:transposase-like protein